MIFNSVTFVLFLLLTVALYWILPRRPRLWTLFTASLVFYGFWRVEFLTLVLFSTVLDYTISLKIGQTPKDQHCKRKQLLILSLCLNLGLLFVFKYLFFFADNAVGLLNLIGVDFEMAHFSIILPLGISFYTFQTISYTVDVYRGHLEPIKEFPLYATYVLYYPQLVAGPILRAQEVTGQLSSRPSFQLNFLSEGIQRVLYGFFLKVVLADSIAPLVDEVYAVDAHDLGGIDVLTIAFLFGFQIYFDFAGYSHIAIGCAKLMGINFPENFNYPYAASSLKSFWKRWHISLSSWIRDYLYLPLTGAVVQKAQAKSVGGLNSVVKESTNKKSIALFLTWAIMGLWHGASWTFVFWGIYHSTLIFLERKLSKTRNSLRLLKTPFVGWLITLTVVMLGWLPFRAQTMNDVMIMYSKLFNVSSFFARAFRENTYLVVFLLFLLVTVSYLCDRYLRRALEKSLVLNWTFNTLKYTTVIILVYIFFRPINQFIYFQF